MNIPLVDLKAQHEELHDEIHSAFLKVVERGDFVLGTEVEAFEEEFADYCDVKHCITVGSGLDAFTLTLRGLGIGPDDESFRTIPIDLRLGWWMTSPRGPGWLRGRFEGMLELSVAPVFEGAGSIVVGPSVLFRYNFVQPGARLVPYFQIGVGVIYTDAYRDRSQDAIGSAVEFSLQGSVGTRFALNSRISLDAELQFHHISNAHLARRNLGVNALGGLIGISYFWGAR